MKEMLEELKESLRNPYYIGLLLILGIATYLRFQFAFFEGMWVDEGRYARIGTEISRHLLDYRVAESWHGTITGIPPVYSYLIALSSLVFGRSEFAVRIVSPVMSVAGIGLTYFLGRELGNRDIGLMAAALLAVNPIFWFLSERILIGATFTTLYTGAIFALYYGLEDRKYSKYGLWALGPLVAINIMTKQPAYTLGLIIPIYFIYKKRAELKEVVSGDVEFQKTRFYDTVLTNQNYYIGAVLGLATILPWMLRNMQACGVPLCGLSRAMDFAGKSANPVLSNVQGTFYFIQSMPVIVTLPVAILLGLRIGQYVLELVDDNPDYLVKAGAATVLLALVANFTLARLLPMAIITSIALIAKTDEEKLLWLWVGIGIGFMSIPSVKVPRYIIFTIPGLAILASLPLYQASGWLSDKIDVEMLKSPRLAFIILAPILLLSFTAGVQRASTGAFTPLGPAGKWMDANVPEDSNVAATSPAVMRYYVHPRMAYEFSRNRSSFADYVRKKNIDFVEVDTYERTQMKWVQTGIPPYRIPNSDRIKLRKRQISPQQYQQRFNQTPDYLTPVKKFGQVRMPLTQKSQPAVIIYRINKSALP